MATINGTNFNDNNTVNGIPFIFRPALNGVIDFPFLDLPDTINGFDGNDILIGLGTNDTLNGGAGNDSLNGAAGNDVLNGDAGNDTLVGGAGVDTLNGGDGNDNIRSDGDSGTYRGEAGNDVMFSGLGNETMDGGTGVDLIDHTAFNGDYVFNMTTGLTNFAGESYTNFENVNMGGGNDNVTGNASDNVINGGAGNDTLTGGNGNDILVGGAGKDTMSDGDGDDIYRYFSTSESAVGAQRDVILDLTGGFDKLDLSFIDADLNIAGNQAFTFIGTNNFTGIAGEVRFFTSGANLILQAEINGDGNIAADMEIQLNGLASISAADIIL
jgi:Ca2+-binding RTX toxin-like protein